MILPESVFVALVWLVVLLVLVVFVTVAYALLRNVPMNELLAAAELE